MHPLGDALGVPLLAEIGVREAAVLGRNDHRIGLRGRGRGLTFSLHHLLGVRADDAVRLEAVLALVRLDLLDGAGAVLPIDLRADDLLHPGVIQPASVRVAVPADEDDVPVLAVVAALVPGPAPGRAVGLEDLLDRAGVDIHREAGAVVREPRRGGVRALDLPPHGTLVDAVGAVALRPPVRPLVAVEEDLLLLLDRPQRVVELEVRVRLGDGEGHEVREGLRRLALELLVPVLVGPAGGQIHQPLVVPAQRQQSHDLTPLLPAATRAASRSPS